MKRKSKSGEKNKQAKTEIKITGKIKCIYDELMCITKIKKNPFNPNKHPEEQIARLAKIIEHQGWRKPLIISNQTGLLITGHGTLECAKLNGYTHIPVSFQDFDNEADEYAHMVADNSLADWSSLDLAQINNDFHEFGPDFDIELLGIKDFDLDKDFEPGTEEDQQQLDKLNPVFCRCPKCGEAFDAREHELKD